MSLHSGPYRIISKVDNKPVGRRLHEDLSLLPKKIAVLPEDAPAVWLVEKQGDDTYILRIKGSYVANFDGQLLAVLMEMDQEKNWRLEAQSQHGHNAYTIASAGSPHLGWNVSTHDEANDEVNVKPLIATKSIPPQFFPNSLFEFIPLIE